MNENDDLLKRADAYVSGEERRAGPVLVEDLAAAVRRLSGVQPIITAFVRSGDPTMGFPDLPYGHRWCTLCRTWMASQPAPPDEHDESCPWRRAVEWVGTQETTT